MWIKRNILQIKKGKELLLVTGPTLLLHLLLDILSFPTGYNTTLCWTDILHELQYKASLNPLTLRYMRVCIQMPFAKIIKNDIEITGTVNGS